MTIQHVKAIVTNSAGSSVETHNTTLEIIDTTGGVTPIWADKLVQSVAINTHLSWRTTVWGQPNWKPLFIELGIRTTRTTLAASNPAAADLADIGAKAINQFNGFDKVKGQDWVNFAKTVAAVIAWEGSNEENAGHPAGWDTNTTDWQNWLYAQRGNIPVISPSIWKRIYSDYVTLGPQQCTFGNLHYYTGGMRPTVTTAGADSDAPSTLSEALSFVDIIAPSKPVYITEIGWQVNGPNQPLSSGVVTQLAQAKYIPRALCECFNRGVVMAAIYTLMDDDRTPPAYHGLITQTFQKRLSFDALKRFLVPFKDPGATFVPVSTPLQMMTPSGVSSLPVMQRRDGTLVFAFWQDVESYDRTNFVDLTPPRLPVTIDLGRTASFVVSEPTLVKAPVSSTGQSVTINVPDHVMIVEAN